MLAHPKYRIGLHLLEITSSLASSATYCVASHLSTYWITKREASYGPIKAAETQLGCETYTNHYRCASTSRQVQAPSKVPPCQVTAANWSSKYLIHGWPRSWHLIHKGQILVVDPGPHPLFFLFSREWPQAPCSLHYLRPLFSG